MARIEMKEVIANICRVMTIPAELEKSIGLVKRASILTIVFIYSD